MITSTYDDLAMRPIELYFIIVMLMVAYFVYEWWNNRRK